MSKFQGFDQSTLSKLLEINRGKPLGLLDRAEAGTTVLRLHDGAAGQNEVVTRVYEFSNSSDAENFKLRLVVAAKKPVIVEKLSAEAYNQQFIAGPTE